DLRGLKDQLISNAFRPAPVAELLRKPRVLVPAVLVLTASLVIAGWGFNHLRRVRSARRQLAQINTLIENGKYFAAIRVAREVQSYFPDEPRVAEVLRDYTFPAKISTKPAGAEVWIKPYTEPGEAWESAGRTPLNSRIPFGPFRLKLSKTGYEPLE